MATTSLEGKALKALEVFQAANGRIFSVDFIKRTTGELRTMNCRTGVTKHLKGGEPAYDALSKGLMTVYSLDSQGYRSINLDGVLTAKVDGKIYDFERVTE